MSHPKGLWIAATCHKVTAKITIDFRPHQDAVTGLRILTIISSNNYIHIVAQYLLHSHTQSYIVIVIVIYIYIIIYHYISPQHSYDHNPGTHKPHPSTKGGSRDEMRRLGLCQCLLQLLRTLARQAESEGRGWEVDWLMVWYTMVNGVVYHG